MEQIIDSSNVMVVWNARIDNHHDIRIPSTLMPLVSKPEGNLKTLIIITPLRNGLVTINILQSHKGNIHYGNQKLLLLRVVNDVMAPLFNDSLSNRRWLPDMLACSCIIYSKYSNGKTATEPFYTPLELTLQHHADRREYVLL